LFTVIVRHQVPLKSGAFAVVLLEMDFSQICEKSAACALVTAAASRSAIAPALAF
jgi:hypothetical protein